MLALYIAARAYTNTRKGTWQHTNPHCVRVRATSRTGVDDFTENGT